MRKTLFVTMFIFWWILTEGNSIGILFGVFVAASCSFVFKKHKSLSVWRMLQFIPFFVLQSFAGGIDVAKRALSRKLPVQPVFIDYDLSLEQEPAKIFFAGVISLLPGTLTAEIHQNQFKIHCLAESTTLEKDLYELERRVGRIFNVPLKENSN